MRQVKSWFESVNIETLKSFALKHYKRIDGLEVKKDAMIISCSNPHTDREWEELYSPFGRIKNKTGVLADLEYAEREFFQIMYEANEGKVINGKRYDEAWKDAHKSSEETNCQSQEIIINEQIAKLNEKKNALKVNSLHKLAEEFEFVDSFVKQKEHERSLIVKDILQGLSKEERTRLLKELGYIPKQKETKEEPAVISNGLNNVVLDFEEPKTTEIDEDDNYYV